MNQPQGQTDESKLKKNKKKMHAHIIIHTFFRFKLIFHKSQVRIQPFPQRLTRA